MKTTQLKSVIDLFEELLQQDNYRTVVFYLYEMCDYDGEAFSPTGHMFYSFDKVGENVLEEITEPGQVVYIYKIKIHTYTLRKIVESSMYFQTKQFLQIIDHLIVEYLDEHERWINNN
jgi:hypothetical protein